MPGRRHSIQALVCGSLLCLAGGGVPAADLQVRLDPAVTFQTMDGFGASDAWQCQFVGQHWPLEKREQIADLLFSRETDAQGNPRGIGLSLWRFNVGAGTAEQGDASDIRNPWRRTECFQSPDGTYNWSKQAGQQWFLQAARRRGVEKFLAFANSPPVHLTRNGKGYAAKGQRGMNIKPDALDDYAVFLADVVEHFQKAGLPFDHLSPFNEPQWNWDEPKQEGTPALNTELHALVRHLSKELSRRRLAAQLVVGEAATINHVAGKVDNDGRDDQARFFFSPESPGYIGDLPNVAPLISAHSYFSVWPLEKQVESRRALRAALQAVNPALGYWQSEYCILERNEEIRGGPGRDLGMDTALFVARIIHHDLTLAHARSWQWWLAVSQGDFKDGLVYLDDGSLGNTGRMGARAAGLMTNGVVRESKLLWVLGNYARFVRPGMVRIKCDVAPEQSCANGLLASAYARPDGGRVVVLVNLSQAEARCDLGRSGEVEVFTTSSQTNLRRSRQNAAGIVLPARSVATVLLPPS